MCGQKLSVSETQAIASRLQVQDNPLISQCLLAVVPGSVSVYRSKLSIVSFSGKFAAGKHPQEALAFPRHSSNEHW